MVGWKTEAEIAGGVILGFLAGTAFALFIVGQDLWDGGIEIGKRLARQEWANQRVTLGNPEHPECSIRVYRSSLEWLTDLGVYDWIITCEFLRKAKGNRQ